MKQKIIDALKTEYASLGFSDKTINRLAEYVQGKVEKEDDIATAIKGDDVKLIAKSIQGELDGLKRAKETAEAALADYKAKHPEKSDPDPDPDPDPKPDIAKLIADGIASGLQPLKDEIAALKSSASAKEALSSARESFFGGDYAKKYKDEADDAWERATELNAATGSKMTAEELAAKATTYFNKAVSRKGVDTSKPFVADKTGDEDEGTTDWGAEKKRLQDAGKLPKEQQV